MSQSTEVPAASDAPTNEEELSEPLTFTLHVVSPSVGVSSPLNFPHLPATTTVKQLKEKIRNALPSKPIDESQRLIHRGRMLGRETETMADIFGHETLANPESQTIHLVLRPTTLESASSVPSTSAPSTVPQTATPNPPLPPQYLPRPQSTPVNPMHGMQAQQPLPGFQHAQQHQLVHQVEHVQNIMAQRLQQLQRETQRLHNEMGILEQRARLHRPGPPPMFNGQPLNGPQIHMPQNPMAQQQGLFRIPAGAPPTMTATLQNLINQQQRDRAAEGRQGAQDNTGQPLPRGPSTTASGRASPNIHRPDHMTTYTRDGIGPNGERWHMTVNAATTTVPIAQPHHPHHHAVQAENSNADLATLLRNFTNQTNQIAQNNMQRSASNPTPTRSFLDPLGGPSVTSEQSSTSVTIGASPTATTFLSSSFPTPQIEAHSAAQAFNQAATPSTHEPLVYILSSPSGPRALLVTNAETYFTPRNPSRHSQPNGQPQAQAGNRADVAARFRPHRQPHRGNDQQNANPFVPVDAAHANPGAGALAAQIGPMLWLIVRLVGFVWFFTAGDPSWTRWLMVSALAVVVFIYNTGILNGVAEQFWGPVRRHLEALIPLGPAEAALIPAANAAVPPQPGDVVAPVGDANPEQRRRRGEPDPAQVAATLIERQRQQRQANENWLMAQVRRAEHSLLLFLASLVPGVGERHIAAREAEANAAEAERQRLIEAANAVEDENANTQGEGEEGGAAAEAGENQPGGPNPDKPEDAVTPNPPLIEV